MKKTINAFKCIVAVLLAIAIMISGIPFVGGLYVAKAATWDGSIAGEYAGGSGTSSDPYKISDGSQLAYLAQEVNSGTNYLNTYFKLTNNIDLGGIEWTSIAYIHDYEKRDLLFAGSFDGDGHTISGLAIDNRNDEDNDSIQGLFGAVSGTVKNLTVSGIVNTKAYGAGIVGYNDGGVIDNCTNKCMVSGYSSGGVVDANVNEGQVISCVNSGIISGQFAGGIAVSNGGEIVYSKNLGDINFSGDFLYTIKNVEVGGIAVFNDGLIEGCFNKGKIVNEGDIEIGSLGGITGEQYGEINNCYNVGNVINKGSVETTDWYFVMGGIAGYVGKEAEISGCYNVGNIIEGQCIGKIYTGGVCGYNKGKINNAYYLSGTGGDGERYEDCISHDIKSLSASEISNKNSYSFNFSGSGAWKMSDDLGRPVLKKNEEKVNEKSGSSGSSSGSSSGGSSSSGSGLSSGGSSAGSTTTVKKPQKISVENTMAAFSASAVKKKDQSFNIGVKCKGKYTCKKVSGSFNISVASDGTIKIPKATPKGTYKITVKIKAAATDTYSAKSIKKKIKVVVSK